MQKRDETAGRSALSVEVGSRLRERRMELGRSLRETALGAAVSSGHLSDIENGKSHASLPVLLRLGRVLQYPLTELLPRIGGHRVHQDALSFDRPQSSDLAHADLDLEASGIRLHAGENVTEALDHGTDAYLYIVSGECALAVGIDQYTLGPGDSADIEHARAVEIHATSDTLLLLVKATRD